MAPIDSLICVCKLECSSPANYSNLEFHISNKIFMWPDFLLVRNLHFQEISRYVGDIVHSNSRKEALQKVSFLWLA